MASLGKHLTLDKGRGPTDAPTLDGSLSSFACLDTSFVCDSNTAFDLGNTSKYKKNKAPSPSREYASIAAALEPLEDEDEDDLSISDFHGEKKVESPIRCAKSPRAYSSPTKRAYQRSLSQRKFALNLPATPLAGADAEEKFEASEVVMVDVLYQRQQTIEMGKLNARIRALEAHLKNKELECEALRALVTSAFPTSPRPTLADRKSASVMHMNSPIKSPRKSPKKAPRKSLAECDLDSPTKAPKKSVRIRIDGEKKEDAKLPSFPRKARKPSKKSSEPKESEKKADHKHSSPRRTMVGRRVASTLTMGLIGSPDLDASETDSKKNEPRDEPLLASPRRAMGGRRLASSSARDKH